jgi:hypothetical protein
LAEFCRATAIALYEISRNLLTFCTGCHHPLPCKPTSILLPVR